VLCRMQIRAAEGLRLEPRISEQQPLQEQQPAS